MRHYRSAMSRYKWCFLLAALALSGCSSEPKKVVKVFPAGEKAQVGALVYSVVDSQVLPRLGDDPATARTPTNRFLLVRVAVSNAGNTESPIPAMTLIDDSGQSYTELADVQGVTQWLGVIRKVGVGETEQGSVVFDAPARHYKLKVTADLDPEEVSIDIPLTFIHEQLNDIPSGPPTEPSIPGKSR